MFPQLKPGTINIQSEHSTEIIRHPLCPEARPYQHWSCLKVIHVEEVPELSLVVEDKIEGQKKTKKLFCFFKNLRPGMISERSMPFRESW